uniref:STAB1 n=1 Tax=Ascaris lumbricoides TaxID=6252 RepID=A0A0M3I7B0_ASCLU
MLAGSSAAGGMLNYPAMLPGQDLAHHMSAGLDFAASYNPQLASEPLLGGFIAPRMGTLILAHQQPIYGKEVKEAKDVAGEESRYEALEGLPSVSGGEPPMKKTKNE